MEKMKLKTILRDRECQINNVRLFNFIIISNCGVSYNRTLIRSRNLSRTDIKTVRIVRKSRDLNSRRRMKT